MNKMNVACAVIVKDNKVFCCKRGPGRSMQGFWEFPGGKIEDGENGFEAAIREIKEELNSEIQPEWTISYSETNHIFMEAILCSLVSGKLELSEHTDAKWLLPDELDTVEWATADKPVVESIKKMLIKQEYTIGFDKERPSPNRWETSLENAAPFLDIKWTAYCSEVEARRKFFEYIKEQSREYNELKTISVWKVIRLYDGFGHQIAQES